MFCLFNITGQLKTGVVFFKRHNPSRISGNTYDVLGNVLVLGTYLDFERRKHRVTEVIEIE